jgi:dienelactone hydrolase
MFGCRQFCLIVSALLLGACSERDAPPAPEQASPPQNVAESAIHDENISGEEIRGEEIGYESGGVRLRGYLAYNAAQSGKRPGVLIVHEWWGHNDYVRERARMLAAMGYTAFALDMYGDGKQAAHPEDAQKFSSAVMSDLPVAEARFLAAKTLLQNQPTVDPAKIAAIGYCFGGGVVLHMARIGTDLKAVASFHGSLATDKPAAPGAIKGRIMVAHGADDPFVTPAELAAFKAEMQAAGAELTFIAYPGVVHSFTNPGATALGEKFNLPLRYDAEADRASWASLKTFLAESFAD